MGHERIGFLPKSKQWQAIIRELGKYDGDSETICEIAGDTLDCIRNEYKRLAFDESMVRAVRFLVTLCFSANTEDQPGYLKSHGFTTDDNMSLLSLLDSVNGYVSTTTESLELNKMVRDATMQALITYKQTHETEQLHFAELEPDNIWHQAGNGSSFCEMARSFIAAFTDRQLRYYLERTAAETLSDYSKLCSFSNRLTEQVSAITGHASDVSKLMQSFAAGWYNNHSAKNLPPDSEISGFLSFTFQKLREEFRREAIEE